MPLLIEYPAWLNKVNEELSRLSAGLFSAEDFDYPWIEKYQANLPAEKAAEEAIKADGFIVGQLAGAVIRARGGALCPA
jgi:hypothetical protein